MKDPDQAAVASSQVILTNQQTKAKRTALTNAQGGYAFPLLPAGTYVLEVDTAGFKPSSSPEIQVAAGQTTQFDFVLTLAGLAQSVTVSAGTVENAYRVDNVDAASPLGPTPILDLPYSVGQVYAGSSPVLLFCSSAITTSLWHLNWLLSVDSNHEPPD